MARNTKNLPITETNLPKIERAAAGIGDYFNWDPKLAGFGLRIRNGTRSFIFQYKLGITHRIRLGGAELTCGQARELAAAERFKLSKARLGHGLDPAKERELRKAESRSTAKARPNSFATIIPTYLDAREGGLKQNTYEAQERHLNIHWKALHDLALSEITRADVAAVLTEITKARGPIAANRARATLSKFFRWAIGEGLCDHNPVVGTNKRDENDPRERSLSDAEVARIWLNAPKNDYGEILKLILLTGCRRAEIGDLKWSEVDIRDKHTITLPRERTKNGQEHVVPLSDDARSILQGAFNPDREYVFGRTRAGGFSGWSKSKSELDAIVKLKEPWTLHDLRRTVRTGLGELGVAPHIAEAAINHLPAKRYDRNKYEPEKRKALNDWAAHLKVAIAQATGANVTRLRKGDGRKPSR